MTSVILLRNGTKGSRSQLLLSKWPIRCIKMYYWRGKLWWPLWISSCLSVIRYKVSPMLCNDACRDDQQSIFPEWASFYHDSHCPSLCGKSTFVTHLLQQDFASTPITSQDSVVVQMLAASLWSYPSQCTASDGVNSGYSCWYVIKYFLWP